MKLKNILIVVKDIEKSKRFYHDLFALDSFSQNPFACKKSSIFLQAIGIRPKDAAKGLERVSWKRYYSGK